ncbi:MAG TPA: UDP-N-acetylmuramoyl-tripeptide--D-alanyl-D-alanine ligase, partial [Actinopolymorphaceae bacterium]
AVGPGAAPIKEGAGVGASYVRDADAAATLLRSELRRHDVVLVKSSRDAGLRYLGDALVSDREENTG